MRKVKNNNNQHQDKHLRAFEVGDLDFNVTSWADELADYTDVLMGRVEPPLDSGTLTMMEVADAYFARASEMTMLIQRMQREGRIDSKSGAYKFRTGELRTFLEMCKRSGDLGSRRITYEAMMREASMTGRAKITEGFHDG